MTHDIHDSWWRHQMETFSVLLTICAGNSPVTGEFPAQRPMTRTFDFFFDLHLNNGCVNNHEASDLRHHCIHYGVTVMYGTVSFCTNPLMCMANVQWLSHWCHNVFFSQWAWDSEDLWSPIGVLMANQTSNTGIWPMKNMYRIHKDLCIYFGVTIRGHIFCVSKVLTNKIRCYICNVLSHWLIPC